jgi:hypothetical protein
MPVPAWCSKRIFIAPIFCFALLAIELTSSPCNAQTQQPFLFASDVANGKFTDIAVFTRNDETGDLTEVSGSPFMAIHSTTCVMNVIDPQGRFAYGPCGLGVSMYTIDATTGAAAEVEGSPFSISTDTDPQIGYVAAESTGQYVYVLKASLNDVYPAISTVIFDTFQVEPASEQLAALGSQSIQLAGTLVSVAASQHGLYLLLNQAEGVAPAPTAMLYAILFDPTTGEASAPQSLMSASNNAIAMLMDSFGKNLVISSGQICGSLWFLQLSTTDGTISASNPFFPPCGELATPIAFDPTSTFFYLQYTGSGVVETGTRIFNVSSATEAPSSPLPASVASEIGGMADPQAPFSFFSGPSPSNGVLVFGVDPSTGYPLLPTAFTNPLFPGRNLILGVATVDVNGEPEQVPAASLSVTGLSFGAVTLGQTSSAQSATLTNSGGLPLSVTSIQVTGTNAVDFTEIDTCMSSPQLQPNKSCTITVSFHPSVAAAESAAVVITDDAAGSPQQIALTGTGTNPGPPPPPTPAVTLNPDPLSFPGKVTEGTVSQAQSIVLTNSGNATLHVKTLVLGGANSGDFAIAANNCIGQVLANANCVVSLTFGPTGSGVRSGTLTITDDAANSPQTMNLVGMGGVAAEIEGSTTASVTAGQTAQFNLQVMPGSGFSGTVTFACSGAPLNATCTAPASVTVSNGAASSFTVTVTTGAGASTSSTAMTAFPRGRLAEACTVLSIVSGLALFFVPSYAQKHRFRGRFFGAVAATAMLFVVSSFGGCSSASNTSSAAQAASTGTPSGIYTITITPTAAPSANPKQQFSLGPFALTLTVN